MGVENLGRKMLSRMLKIWGRKCYLGSRIWGLENLGLENAISKLQFGGGGGGWKIWVENAISNLEFGWWKIWGGKCYLETPIWGGGGKFG